MVLSSDPGRHQVAVFYCLRGRLHEERDEQADATAHPQPEDPAAARLDRIPASREQVLVPRAPDTAGEAHAHIHTHTHTHVYP